ncbi:MAG: zf-HC2 domain-containing protein [Bryobacterales bacterium]|nr:zf-HC2 domain-containing protein [Bryobacterales bacterium]
MEFSLAFLSSKPCARVTRSLSAYVDGALPNAERREASIHIRECSRCGEQVEQLRQARNLVRRLPARTPPIQLTAKLRQLAAAESADARSRAKVNPVRFAWQAIQIRMENLMRPLAIPFAGGMVSAMVLFSMLVPTYPVVAARTVLEDVPTALYQEPTVKSVAPFAFADQEFVVEVTIDEQGQVIDYKLPRGTESEELKREIENTLLFARFTPALAFGQPTAGKVRLSFRRSFIDVKG